MNKHLFSVVEEACRHRPFYTPVIANLKFVPREAIATFSVSKYGIVYYNDAWVSLTTVDHLLFYLLQIVEQLLRHHAERRRGRDMHVWSIACMVELGDSMQQQGYKAPKDCLTPGKLNLRPGLSAEQYYDKLIERDVIELPRTLLDGRGNPVDGDVKLIFKRDVGMAVIPGSAMTGEVEDWEAEAGEGLMGLMWDPLLFSGIEEDARDFARQLGELGHGDVPDWLFRSAEAANARIPWKTRLSRVLGNDRWGTGASVPSWCQPCLYELSIGDGVLLPGWESYSPTIALVIDT